MRIEIPEATCSLNILKRKYANRHAYAKERNRWHYIIREITGPPAKEPIADCEITVTRHGGQLLDWDNMGGGLKFLFDALVSNGVIVDDNPRVVRRLLLAQYLDRRNPRTVVEIAR